MQRISLIALLLPLLLICGCCGTDDDVCYNDGLPPVVDEYVGLQDDVFVLGGKKWFPIMLNYKVEMRRVGDSLEVVPASYYRTGTLRQHFDTIASWGFNAVRVCLDVLPSDEDSSAMFRATRRMVQQADSAGLHVMLLIKPPFDRYWQAYTKGLLRSLADLPALWAYDFMNEPLYFDPEPNRDKLDAVCLVSRWRHWVRQFAPHQLFTVATAEPIEVFEWDPSMLPVDFVEMHTYHPLRVFSEMWWYSRYCGKPWMVGETGLPSDDDSVPYIWQFYFMDQTYVRAVDLGAVGYGWWEFGDCPEGVNFEAKYTGLRDTNGKAKLAADWMKYRPWICFGCAEVQLFPVNYYNMLGYSNIRLTGTVVDENDSPVEGAVLRGWNDDWSVGMNTFTDSVGRFTLFSNDYCVHFELSAPGMSNKKFDRRNIKYTHVDGTSHDNLPDRSREYQQIPYIQYMRYDSVDDMPVFIIYDSTWFFRYSLTADLGTIKIKKL